MQDDAPVGLDGLKVSFGDKRAVSDASVALVATLAGRLKDATALPASVAQSGGTD